MTLGPNGTASKIAPHAVEVYTGKLEFAHISGHISILSLSLHLSRHLSYIHTHTHTHTHTRIHTHTHVHTRRHTHTSTQTYIHTHAHAHAHAHTYTRTHTHTHTHTQTHSHPHTHPHTHTHIKNWSKEDSILETTHNNVYPQVETLCDRYGSLLTIPLLGYLQRTESRRMRLAMRVLANRNASFRSPFSVLTRQIAWIFRHGCVCVERVLQRVAVCCSDSTDSVDLQMWVCVCCKFVALHCSVLQCGAVR